VSEIEEAQLLAAAVNLTLPAGENLTVVRSHSGLACA
jgi:hypothetical protein